MAPTVFTEYVFYFRSGHTEAVTVTHGRDSLTVEGQKLTIQLNHPSGDQEELAINQQDVILARSVTRTLEPEVRTEEAGRLTLVGALDGPL